MALEVSDAAAQKLVRRDTHELAPQFQTAITNVQELCKLDNTPFIIWECVRTHQLAEMYYKLGKSKAQNGWRTWHFYGLAIDVIHPTKRWDAWPEWSWKLEKFIGGDIPWYTNVVHRFKEAGIDWGGDWKSFKDCPHFQWGRCKPSPSDEAIRLFKAGGFPAVWNAVKAA